MRVSVVLAALLVASPLPAADLRTHAERSDYRETGRYVEVESLCKQFESDYPEQVRCFSFGTSPEGRPMWALAANAHGVLTPEQAQRAGLPVVLFQGGIHAGEIDGKDAGFRVLRELLQEPKNPNPLRSQVMLFVPVFNVDGHERFAAWNRPNQRGPVEMGWRTTGQNFNLNRDYMKADAPEMQHMLDLVQAWDPLFYVDLHVTDGAQFRHDISVQVEPKFAGDADLQAIGRKFQNPSIYENLTVFENLELSHPTGRGVIGCLMFRRTAAIKKQCDDVAAQIGLSDRIDTEAGILSHGQKQWLEIGMLLMQDPEIIMLDEPVAGMSVRERTETASLIRKISKDRSVIVIEHDMEFVREIADRVTVMHLGKILAEGSMEKISQDPKVIEVYIGH